MAQVFFNKTYCYFCGNRASETHHVFGAANRPQSTKYGCLVSLCHNCHSKVHFDGDRSYMIRLRKDCEQWCLDTYNWSISDFRKEFGRNYLDE